MRHGEVEQRYHKIFGGSRIDMELSPLGLSQGEAIANWLGDTSFDAVYASPMKRVQQTMQPLLDRRGIAPIIVPEIREMDFGDWTGFRWDEVQEKFGVSAFDWLEIIEEKGIANGESARHLIERVQPALLRIIRENPHRKVAVFCHGGIIRVMLALLLDMPLKRMAHFNIEYGSVSVVELQPEKKHAVEIELLNFCPPLARTQP